jgi:hypothetical protein
MIIVIATRRISHSLTRKRSPLLCPQDASGQRCIILSGSWNWASRWLTLQSAFTIMAHNRNIGSIEHPPSSILSKKHIVFDYSYSAREKRKHTKKDILQHMSVIKPYL